MKKARESNSQAFINRKGRSGRPSGYYGRTAPAAGVNYTGFSGRTSGAGYSGSCRLHLSYTEDQPALGLPSIFLFLSGLGAIGGILPLPI